VALKQIPRGNEYLKLAITVDKNNYLVGEPVIIQFQFKNITKQPVDLNNLQWENGGEMLFSVTAHNEQGEGLAALTKCCLRQAPGPDEVQVIGPADTFTREIELAKIYPEIGPGTYELTGIYRNYKYDRPIDNKIWVGEIYSNALKITIKRLGQDALDSVLADLGPGKDEAEQLRAMRILALHQDGRAIPALKRIAMQDANPNSGEAIRSLGLIGDEAVGTLYFLMSNQDKSHWPEIIFALGLTHSPKALDYLLPLLPTKQDENISAWALKALANIRDPQVPELIIRKLKDPRETIRQIAVECLGKSRAPQAVPVLQAMLEQEFRANVRRQVAKALYFLTGEIYAYKDYQDKVAAFDPEKDLTQEEKDAANDYLVRPGRPVKTDTEE
jgi:hypothetical protein